MEAIPLLCKVCPKKPHFSDISHLLTHVDSKGHLKYYSTAKIRGREDPSIRQQFDEFNEWYERHGIERLLSQRILQKDSRNKTAKAKALRETAAKPAKNPKRTRKRRSNLPDKVDDPGAKDVIDPRLSQFEDANPTTQPTGAEMTPQSPPPFDLASLHPRQVSKRRSWTLQGHDRQELTGRSNSYMDDGGSKSDTDMEEASDWMDSPRQEDTNYPDPSALPGSFPFTHASSPESTSERPKASTGSPSQRSEYSQHTSEKGDSHMIKLKGPQWPGMALFDSASPEAQRMRNQKKEHSSLEQMEYTSTIVQPLERIYFLDGSLKKERPITGDVESSPLIEPTPKPKRRKAKTGRTILDNLSTNLPKGRVSRAAKQAVPEQVTEETDPFVPRPIQTECDSSCRTEAAEVASNAGNHADSGRWLLNTALPEVENRRSFSVFRDSVDKAHWNGPHHFEEQPPSIDHPFLKPPNVHPINFHHGLPGPQSIMHPDGIAAVMRQAQSRANTLDQSGHGTWDHCLRSSRTIRAGKENMEPILKPNGSIDNQASRARGQRITQRYFSVSGSNHPQFFDALPSELEFGGLADRSMMGSSLNPLNPQFVQRQPQLQDTEPQFATPISIYRHSDGHYDLAHKDENREFGRQPAMRSSTETERTWSRS